MRKPFVFKPTLPYGSPGAPVNTAPPRPNVEGMDTKSDSLTVQPPGIMVTGQRSIQPPMMSGVPIADQPSPLGKSLSKLSPVSSLLYMVLASTQVNGTGHLVRTLPRPPPLLFKR